MRRNYLVGIALFGILVLTSCGTSSNPNSMGSVPKSEATKPTLNLLTGLPGTNGPVLAVKVDDTRPAHPQIGLQYADVVYVEQVEGGLTRLAAFYSQHLPEDIGPVRSARISDIDILAQYGRVGFAFSGAQSKLYPVINAANLVNLSADRNSSTIYFRDNTRFSPTNLILKPKLLMAKALTQDHATIDTVKSIGFTFGEIANGGTSITSMKVKWPAADYEAIWSTSESRWLLSHDGKPDLASTGENLGSPTILIQIVSITNSIYQDREGGITPFSNTVGTGTGYLLRGGKAFSLTWNRPSPTAGTTWNLLDGSPANLAPGQIWIMLTDHQPTFVSPVAPSASSSPSK
ncbi:MAG: DUF3048 domain-containing protein [Actinomycetes bacterium]